jgi:hypothetical protein
MAVKKNIIVKTANDTFVARVNSKVIKTIITTYVVVFELSASSAPGAIPVAPTSFRTSSGRTLCESSLIHGDTGLSQKMAAELSGEARKSPSSF